MATFVGTCVGLPARHLDEYDASSREITYRTFRKHVGSKVVKSFDQGVPLSRDWAVSFSRGKWRGRPAVCCMHSLIHNIWLIDK